MVHLQSGLYCRCCICVHFRLTQCVWLHLIEVCFLFIVCDRGHKSKLLESVVCVCRRARILLDVPRFCEDRASQVAGSDARPAKNRTGPTSMGQGLC